MMNRQNIKSVMLDKESKPRRRLPSISLNPYQVSLVVNQELRQKNSPKLKHPSKTRRQSWDREALFHKPVKHKLPNLKLHSARRKQEVEAPSEFLQASALVKISAKESHRSAFRMTGMQGMGEDQPLNNRITVAGLAQTSRNNNHLRQTQSSLGKHNSNVFNFAEISRNSL